MANRHLLVVGSLTSLILVALCVGDARTGEQYMALLEGGVSKAAIAAAHTVTGDPYHGLPLSTKRLGGVTVRRFAPLQGLDSQEAVPFLIEVVKRGPVGSEFLTGRHPMRGVSGDGRASYVDLAQCYAALCLGAIKDPRALEPLVEAMEGRIAEGTEGPVRLPAYAATALAFLGDYRAIEPLIEALNHQDVPVRGAAAAALSVLLETPIDALAAATGDPETSTIPRDIWGRLLTRCLDVYEEELRHADPQRRALAASSVAIYLKEPLKRVRACSTSADQQVREAAQKALGEIRDVVGPAEVELETE